MGTNFGQVKKINIGCNTLIFKGKKLLLGKRKNCAGEGTYGLPGGHLEFGENLIDAAKRELKEELGIESDGIKLISVTEGTKYPDSHYIQVNFLLPDFKGEVTLMEPDKCEEWKYFDLKSLPEIFPPHQKIIEAYRKKEFYLS
jgi:8-oxo-dGTP diphosphatase